MKPYLVNIRSIDLRTVVVIFGGYRESWTAELWIVPKNEKPPVPMPTLKRRDIRFRKDRVRIRDFSVKCNES